MDKAEIITSLRARNQEEFDTLARGKSVDTNPERVAKRMEELKSSLAAAQEVVEPKDRVEVGSLVVYEEVGKEFYCLILPGCMGDMLQHRVGDEVFVQTGKIQRKLKIKEIL